MVMCMDRPCLRWTPVPMPTGSKDRHAQHAQHASFIPHISQLKLHVVLLKLQCSQDGHDRQAGLQRVCNQKLAVARSRKGLRSARTMPGVEYMTSRSTPVCACDRTGCPPAASLKTAELHHMQGLAWHPWGCQHQLPRGSPEDVQIWLRAVCCPGWTAQPPIPASITH